MSIEAEVCGDAQELEERKNYAHRNLIKNGKKVLLAEKYNVKT